MNDSELDQLLRGAGEGPALPPSFKRAVWLRIESSSSGSTPLVLWMERAFHWASKPLAGAVAILTMIFIGLGLGAGTATRSENLKEAYVQSVSPFAAGHQP